MKNKKDSDIDDTVEKLTELAHSYQGALDCANEIISMKNRMIELCEMETALHRKENLRLQSIIFWLSVSLCAFITLSFLFHII